MPQEIVNITLREGIFCLMLIGTVVWVAKTIKEDKANTNRIISESHNIINRQGNIIIEQGKLIEKQSEVIKDLHKIVNEQVNKISSLACAVDTLTNTIMNMDKNEVE